MKQSSHKKAQKEQKRDEWSSYYLNSFCAFLWLNKSVPFVAKAL